MTISVTCTECNKQYRLADAMAGKSFACKECSARIKVPVGSGIRSSTEHNDDQEPKALPKRARRPKPSKVKKSTPRRSRFLDDLSPGIQFAGAAVVALLIVGLLAVAFPRLAFVLAGGVMAVSALFNITVGFMVLLKAFEEDVLCGLLMLFVPMYGLYYVVSRWHDIAPLGMFVVGGIALNLTAITMLFGSLTLTLTTLPSAEPVAGQPLSAPQASESPKVADWSVQPDPAPPAWTVTEVSPTLNLDVNTILNHVLFADGPFVLTDPNPGPHQKLSVWNLKDGQSSGAVPEQPNEWYLPLHTGAVLSGDGRHLAFQSRKEPFNRVRIVSTTDSTVVRDLAIEPAQRISEISFGPPGRLLLHAQPDAQQAERLVCVDYTTGDVKWTLAHKHSERVKQVHAPKWESTTDGQPVNIGSLSWAAVHHPLGRGKFVMSPGRRYCLFVDATANIGMNSATFYEVNPDYKVLDLATGTLAGRFTLPRQGSLASRRTLGLLDGIAFSPDGTKLAVLKSSRTHSSIDVLDVPTGKFGIPTLVPALPEATSYEGPRLEWLPDQSGWILDGSHMLDLATQRVVWVDRGVGDASDNRNRFRRKWVPGGYVAVAGATGATTLKFIPLDWEAIRRQATETGKPVVVEAMPRFDHMAWKSVSEQLKAHNITAALAHRPNRHTEWLDHVEVVAVVDAPQSVEDGTIPTDTWKLLSSVAFLSIRTKSLSDAGLQQLAEHPGMVAVTINGPCAITPSGIGQLAKCSHFTGFHLSGVPVSMEQLQALSALPHLRALSINEASVSKEMIDVISQLSELRSLSLQQSGISDADIDQLAKLTKLETLFLDNSKVTNAGLASLKALKNLKMLSIRGLAVSPQAVSEMQAALPGCRILK